MDKTLRAVLDTNVIIAIALSKNDKGPNKEILRRIFRKEFKILYSTGIFAEYSAKLLEKGVVQSDIDELLELLRLLGEEIRIQNFHIRRYPKDPDDVEFVLCATNGFADYVVSYDRHLLEFDSQIPYKICEPIEFLRGVRKSLADKGGE